MKKGILKEICVHSVIGIVLIAGLAFLTYIFLEEIHYRVEKESLSNFTKLGSIGSGIGGVVTLLVGAFSIYLLASTLGQQLRFNKQQKRIAFEEQFKSVFFSLLQVQRNIAESIEGELSFLKGRVDEVCDDSYFSDMYKIIKLDKKSGYNEFCTIQKKEETDITKGNQFFIKSKKQLYHLFLSIAQHQYSSNYNQEDAHSLEIYLENKVSQYHEHEQDSFLEEHRRPLRSVFYNTKYSISENAHKLYHQSDDKKKIAIVYAHFYNKQPRLRHYFKHLLAILRYVKESEDECVSFKTDKEEIETIRSQFKSQAQFIASQMTNDEVVIVYYHAFLDNEFRELIIKYDLLKDLVVEDVLFGHNCLEGYTLKSRKTELNEMLGTI